MKVEYDFKGERRIVEIGNDESEAKIREREYVLYTYLINAPESAREQYIYSAKTFFKKTNEQRLIQSDNIINPFNIKIDYIQFCKDILENIKTIESYQKIDNDIRHNATRTFLGNYFIDFVENFTMPQIWWLNISEQEKYWEEQYPLDKWRLGKNDDMIVYEYRDNVKEGDIAIFYFTGDIKAVRYIGRVYKIDEYIYFDMLSKIEKGFDLQEIRNMNDLENYPPQGGFSKMRNQQIALELVIKCFENGQLQHNMVANQNSEKQENEPIINTDSIKGENMKTIPTLNQILYGPPGTGKTYGTIDKALEILRHYKVIDEIPKSREDKRAIFDEYRANKQIEFVTFHQSFSYEEFVEGIKPNTNNPENMIYEPKAGIFKEICKSALKILQDSPKTKEVLQDEEIFENTLDEFLSCLVKNKTTIKKSNVGSFQISRFDENKIYISTPDTPRNVDLKIDTFAKILQSGKEFNTAQSIWNEFVGYYRDQRATYYFQLYNEFRNFEKTYSKPQAQNIDKVVLKPYILIIDEINRGNISKILGELITLIEPSKRIGASEELRVTLPYSNDSFGVPSNLYIIGTMNTADRSIALLDTALRRRFEFVEMMPNPKLLKDNKVENTEINLQTLLEKMNERIEFLLDREHTIGHSFFIGVDSLDKLREVFKLKIIPLLQEYFYDDYAKISAVLNGNGMIKSFSKEQLKVNLSDDFVYSDKKVYRITKSNMWKKENFQRIYDSNVKIDKDE